MDTIKDELLRQFGDYLVLEKGMMALSEKAYLTDIRIFFDFLENRNVSLELFNTEDIRDYLETRTNQQCKPSSIARYLSALHAYIRFLRSDDRRDDDPLIDIDRPKNRKPLPKIMSEHVVCEFLQSPDTSNHEGLRDKAMFELIYASGLRVSELVNLTFESLHLDEQYIVIKGKGGKERLIPITESSAYWIRLYVETERANKDPTNSSPCVFLSKKTDEQGTPKAMTRIAFWYRVKLYAKKIGLIAEPSPHTFRHAFATHLLNHDADLRSIQMMLGHASLSTTQIYTHIATLRMHQVYEQAHPRA